MEVSLLLNLIKLFFFSLQGGFLRSDQSRNTLVYGAEKSTTSEVKDADLCVPCENCKQLPVWREFHRQSVGVIVCQLVVAGFR